MKILSKTVSLVAFFLSMISIALMVLTIIYYPDLQSYENYISRIDSIIFILFLVRIILIPIFDKQIKKRQRRMTGMQEGQNQETEYSGNELLVGLSGITWQISMLASYICGRMIRSGEKYSLVKKILLGKYSLVFRSMAIGALAILCADLPPDLFLLLKKDKDDQKEDSGTQGQDETSPESPREEDIESQKEDSETQEQDEDTE